MWCPEKKKDHELSDRDQTLVVHLMTVNDNMNAREKSVTEVDGEAAELQNLLLQN